MVNTWGHTHILVLSLAVLNTFELFSVFILFLNISHLRTRYMGLMPGVLIVFCRSRVFLFKTTFVHQNLFWKGIVFYETTTTFLLLLMPFLVVWI